MPNQLALWGNDTQEAAPSNGEVAIPEAVARAMAQGAALAISISGGKDSQVMLEALAHAHRLHAWRGPIHAIHADLGRAEWPQTPGHVRFCADRVNVPLTIVRRPQGDLLDEIRQRVQTLGNTAPAWPSAAARYCTADQKRAQIDKVIRSSPWPTASQRYCTADQKRDQLLKKQRTLGDIVVTAMGMRAQEGCAVCRKAAKLGRNPGPHQHKSARARREVVSVSQRLTSKRLASLSPTEALDAWQPGDRLVLEWLPIHEWLETDVWLGLGSSQEDVDRRRAVWKAGQRDEALHGWMAHPAYVMGNVRLSCSLCVLGCTSDLENGARANPFLFREYLKIELETGYTFKADQSLANLSAARELAADLLDTGDNNSHTG